jgi:glutamate N-acetyltransferase/amino-acid N-acetyltransferase
MHPVSGVLLGTHCAQIKQSARDDLLVIAMDSGSTCSAVFTQNLFCAAPVVLAKQNMSESPRWLVINSGNANAGTGAQGYQDAQSVCLALSQILGGHADQVLPFSTGVIGELLPVEKITQALPEAVNNLIEGNWAKAAEAIMTTDTFPKGVSKVVEIAGDKITVTGISKGAGMIQPNMATMLSFVATDAKIENELLQQCLKQAVEQSFNRITVDGDTSTNDACVLMASGYSGVPELLAGSEPYQQFCEVINEVFAELAEAIVRDGEGATKLISIVVSQAISDQEAVQVGKTIAHSPLVKTAFFASDPNWGRILAAVGRAGIENLELDKVFIFLGDVCIVSLGAKDSQYTEAAGQKVMDAEEITITVCLGRGDARQTIKTCDLSYDYVRINAEYRT